MIGLLLLIAIAGAVDTDLSAPVVQVKMVDGAIVQGKLQDLQDGQITLITADGEKKMLPDEVLNIATQAQPTTRNEKTVAWIELIDGSKLTAQEFVVQGDTAKITYNNDKVSDIPTERIRRVRFSSSDDSIAPKWPSNAGAGATSDLLVVRKNDQIDFMEGSLGNVDDRFVVLKADGEKYPVKRSKVDGLIYYHNTVDKFPDPLCVVETTAGWQLKAKDVKFVASSFSAPYGRFEIITVSGGIFYFLTSDEITKLDFSAGKIGYLSDLEPVSVQWTPYLDFGDSVPAMAEFYAPRRDEGREHQPLRLAGKEYNKGMSLYPRTTIEYRVPSGMKKFKAAAGIDDAVRETGNARLAISADGKMLFDRTIRGKDAPIDLDLDLSGVKRLSILVDFGDQFDAGDFLDLAEARMVK